MDMDRDTAPDGVEEEDTDRDTEHTLLPIPPQDQ